MESAVPFDGVQYPAEQEVGDHRLSGRQGGRDRVGDGLPGSAPAGVAVIPRYPDARIFTVRRLATWRYTLRGVAPFTVVAVSRPR